MRSIMFTRHIILVQKSTAENDISGEQSIIIKNELQIQHKKGE